jgi:hypothetical protein
LKEADEMHPEFLRYDPLPVFRDSNTPAGLYARQRWMKEGSTSSWEADLRDRVKALSAGQQKNGSWDKSLLETIRRLFGLHLTLRNRNGQIERALEWLLSDDTFMTEKETSHKKVRLISSRDLVNLPFSSGCYNHFARSAILFIASLFGYESDERVIRSYDMLSGIETGKKMKWCNWSCINNSLRACIVHPQYRDCGAVRLFVSELRELQKADGTWPQPIPLYQTVNALGHLDSDESDGILERSFRYLREKQNSDGTWGRGIKEWNTFLIVHAIKRKGSLLQKIQSAP